MLPILVLFHSASWVSSGLLYPDGLNWTLLRGQSEGPARMGEERQFSPKKLKCVNESMSRGAFLGKLKSK